MGDLAPRRMAISQAGKDERMTEQVRFEKGDVVRVINGTTLLPEGSEHTVLRVYDPEATQIDVSGTGPDWPYGPERFELVRRASESQRDGGFAGWVEVDRNTTHRKYEGRNSHGAACFAIGDIEDDAPHASTVEPHQAYPNEIELGERGYRSRFCGSDWTNHSYVPYGEPEPEPPQPAPMTRAARVLAGMMADPYQEQPNATQSRSYEAEHRNEAARLRMARMSLDDELTYDQTRWRKLVLAKVPVGRR